MKKKVRVEFEVEIDYNKTSFSKEFMEAFRGYMYPFHTINDHLEHLAQLKVRGLAEDDEFVEGYGEIKEKRGITMISELANIEVL
jgi:hypothetical protein